VSKIAMALEILGDGRWHRIDELLSRLKLSEDKFRDLTSFLNAYSFVKVDEKNGRVKISEVEVEALNGKSTRCKVKQIKKSKDSGKGIIKMPEKIQLTLETASGELVTVKPVVE